MSAISGRPTMHDVRYAALISFAPWAIGFLVWVCEVLVFAGSLDLGAMSFYSTEALWLQPFIVFVAVIALRRSIYRHSQWLTDRSGMAATVMCVSFVAWLLAGACSLSLSAVGIGALAFIVTGNFAATYILTAAVGPR